MIPRLVDMLRLALAAIGLTILLIGMPILLWTVAQQSLSFPNDAAWFRYDENMQAPPFSQQFSDWADHTYHALRLGLGADGLVLVLMLTLGAAAWLGLAWLTLVELALLARDGTMLLVERARLAGPRGWIASLLATLALSTSAHTASAASAAPTTAATAPPQPGTADRAGDESDAGFKATTRGGYTDPPPTTPTTHLPDELRPDCPRYRVHAGDTLIRIATQHLGDAARWRELAELNQPWLANPHQLTPGWQLLLPPDAASPDQPEVTEITVARGDTLASLAARHLGDANRLGELFNLNVGRSQPDGLQLAEADIVLPGWKLLVPVDNGAPRVDAGPAPSPPDAAELSGSPVPTPGKDPTSPAPAPPAPVPPQPPVPARDNEPHRDEDGERHPDADGVAPAPGVFLGLGMAAAFNVALARARTRHRRLSQPDQPFTDYQLTPTVYALRIAHLNSTQDVDTGEHRHTVHTHPIRAECTACRPTSSTPDTSSTTQSAPRLSVELGVQYEQTVHLDLAACGGLGLAGDAHQAVAQALLLHLLSRHTTREQPPVRLLLTRPEATLLLPEQDTPPATVQIVDDLPAALNTLHQQHPDTGPTTEPAHTVLVTRSPAEHAHRLHQLLSTHDDLSAVLLGPWPDGTTLSTDPDATITHATPTAADELRGTQLFTATPTAARDLLPLTPTPTTPLPTPGTTPNLRELTFPTRASTDTAGQDATTPADHEPHTDNTSTETIRADGHASTVGAPQVAHAPTPPHTSDTEPHEADPRASGQPCSSLDSLESVSDEQSRDDTPPPVRDPHTPPVRLHVFGPFRMIWTNPAGEAHELTGITPRQRSLLTYLAIHPGGVARETLLADVWSHSEITQPTNTCNTLLSRLRTTLENATTNDISNLLETTGQRFRLNPRIISTDYAEFDHATTNRRHASTPEQRLQSLQTLIRCHTGPLGPDIDDEWIQTPRHEADRVYINAIGELARHQVDHAPQHTLDLLESALRHDPYNEHLYRDIMRLQHQLGLTDAISRTHTLLKTRLAEIDSQPTPETTNLARQLPQHTPPSAT